MNSPLLPKIGGTIGVNTLGGIGVTMFTAIILFILTTTYTSLIGRVDKLEAIQAGHSEAISTLRVQIDTVNQRGTASSDTRLSAVEGRVTVLESRINRLEALVFPQRPASN